MGRLTDREYEEMIESIRKRPAATVCGVWFNVVRYGECDLVQGHVLDERTGTAGYRPIAALACGSQLEDIAGPWPKITGHPVGKKEGILLANYLSSRDGRDVELLVPARHRARTVEWGRFNERKEFRIYSDHIHPEIINAIDRIEASLGVREALACPSYLRRAERSAGCPKERLLDLGCGCGDLIDSIKCHYCRKQYEGRWEGCGCGNLIDTARVSIPDFDCCGVDINSENVCAANEKRVGHIFEGDCSQLESVLAAGLDFDIIVCCGLLNRQVTSKEEAGAILAKALSRLRRGGHIIVTGYTACHLAAEDFSRLEIEVLQKSIPRNLFKSYREYHLRQFYVGRKR